MHDLLNKWRHTAYLEMRNPGSYYRMLAKAEQIMRAGHNPDAVSFEGMQALIRTFASAGTLSAEPDLAERVEEILGTEPGYCCHPA